MDGQWTGGDTAQVVIGLLAFAAAVSSAISALRSWEAADVANEVSKRSLDLAMHDHKAKYLPIIIGFHHNPSFNLNDPNGNGDAIFIHIRNTVNAPCTITHIQCLSYFQLNQSNIQTEIPYNNKASFSLKFTFPNTRQELINEAIQYSAVEQNRKQYCIHHIIQKLQQTQFFVRYKDRFNDSYSVWLAYDASKKIFVSTPPAKLP
jgi:hypothetical protein